MMVAPYQSIEAHRAHLTETYRAAMSRLDRMGDAHSVCVAMMGEWTGHKEGREARIYVGDSALMVTLVLATGEIFADAAEVFETAEAEILATVPEGWAAEWSEVRDESSAREARRQTIMHANPEDGAWYHNGFSIWLTVSARVGEGAACQVVEIGKREETVNRQETRMVPIFKAICPGDPVPLAAE